MTALDWNKVRSRLDERGVAYSDDVELSKVSWIKMGGKISLFIRPQNREELVEVVRCLVEFGAPLRIFGNTSNCFFSEGIHPCIVSTQKVRGFEIEEDSGRVTADCGASLTVLGKRTARAGLAGLEGMVGIPATVGGAVFMNAGSYQNVVSKVFVEADYVDLEGQLRTITAAEMDFAYRTTAFRQGKVKGIIVSATFQLERDSSEQLLKRVADVTEHRNTFQEKNNTNLGTLSCTPTFYREIILANPGFGLTCGLLILLQRALFRLREKFTGTPFPAKRTLEIKLIKWWFKYPLPRRVHSEFSLNCFISTHAQPGDFEIYTEWLKQVAKGRIELENEYINAQ